MAGDIIICNVGAAPTSPISGDIVVCDKDNTGVNTGYDITVCPEQQPFDIIGPQRCMLGTVYYTVGGVAPYTWDITALDPGQSAKPSWSTTTHPETGLTDGSAIQITSILDCCGSGLIDVTDGQAATAQKGIRFPSGSWKLTHYDGAFVGPGVYPNIFDFSAADVAAAINSCCIDTTGAQQTEIHRVDDIYYNNVQPVAFCDGDIAYVEYYRSYYPDGSGWAATPGNDDCPAAIKNLATSEQQNLAALACAAGYLWTVSGKEAIDWAIPNTQSIDDYEFAYTNTDVVTYAVRRVFYQWQCGRYNGGSQDPNFFSFKGITP